MSRTNSALTSRWNLGTAREVGGEGSRVVTDSLEVGAGFRIARFGELGQSEDGQVARFQVDNSFAGADACDQFQGPKGLGDEVVGAGV